MITAALGWLGTAGTFAAYFLLVSGRVDATSLRYAMLNTVGGLLAFSAALLYGAWPSAVSNIVWAGFGLHTLVSTVRTRRAHRALPDPDGDPDPLPPVELAVVRSARSAHDAGRVGLPEAA